jgi:murein DD-endopeptidase MepM/ murein hydrolase activator NlpD
VKDTEYNAGQLAGGVLTIEHVTALVRYWQDKHELEADGMAGPKTIRSLDIATRGATTWTLRYPLPRLADGRLPQVTSEFRPLDRPNHDGIDLFYPWREGDKPDFVGDHGAAGWTEDGRPKWVVPLETPALAAADGVVQMAGNSGTGWRLWIDHENGLRTGYFHLVNLRVDAGSRVKAGDVLGMVGDNPKDNDGRHLHFELSPVSSYAPMDPAPYLRR